MARAWVALITVVASAAILGIAWTGNGPRWFRFVEHVPGEDKTFHVVLLALLTWSVTWLSRHRPVPGGRTWLAPWVVFAAITIEEGLQVFSPHRNCDWGDYACNLAGIAVGCVLAAAVQRRQGVR